MFRRTLWLLLFAATCALASDRAVLKTDTSEADSVLRILNLTANKQPVTSAEWNALFTSEPYVRLKRREASMRRDFTDDDFKKFVLSPDLAARRSDLQRTLDAWKRADLNAAAARILPFLPATAVIRATVYPVIKPKTNSFVFETTTNPAIFLFVDPGVSPAQFENTVAHELHHVGLTDATRKYDGLVEAAASPRKHVLTWIGAFGEGLAVLAAAGSADVPPLQPYPKEDQIRWDQDMKFVDDQLAQLNTFFEDILRGGFADEQTLQHVAFTFFGYRGPWYTVGYKMGAVIEKHDGRAVLVECMTDPRKLLLRYNDAARALNANATPQDRLPLWSDAVIQAVRD